MIMALFAGRANASAGTGPTAARAVPVSREDVAKITPTPTTAAAVIIKRRLRFILLVLLGSRNEE
jgi:hypothetical protein